MILSIGKTNWLLGMHWDAFDTAPSIGEIKREAQSLGANMYALRISDLAVQAGYYSDEHSSKNKRGQKVFALAARLAGAVAEPWFGIFDLGDGLYWYIAVRDGYSILPDGDVIGSFEDIEAARANHAGFNDWEKIEGTVSTLESLLDEIARQEQASGIKKAKLVRVEVFGQKTIAYAKWGAAAAGASIVVGSAFFWHFENLKEQERLALERRQAIAVAQEQNKALAPLASPLPNAWLAACKEVLFATPIVQFGWQLSSVSCSGPNAIVEWKLAPGATVRNRPDGSLSPDGALITQNIALDAARLGMVAPLSAPGLLLENQEGLRFVAQSTGMNLELVAAQEVGANLPGQVNAAMNVAADAIAGTPKKLRNQSFRLVNKTSPFAIDFDSVPSLRISKVISNLTTDKGWEIEGVIYGF